MAPPRAGQATSKHNKHKHYKLLVFTVLVLLSLNDNVLHYICVTLTHLHQNNPRSSTGHSKMLACSLPQLIIHPAEGDVLASKAANSLTQQLLCYSKEYVTVMPLHQSCITPNFGSK